MALELEERLSVLPAVLPGEELPASTAADLMRECREYQSRLFRLRDHAERVPKHIYRRHKNRDEEAARTAADRLRARLLGLNAR